MSSSPINSCPPFSSLIFHRKSCKPILIALEIIGGLALTGVAVYLLFGVNAVGAIAGAGAGGLLLTGGAVVTTAYFLKEHKVAPQKPIAAPPTVQEVAPVTVQEEEGGGPVLKGSVYIHTLQSGPIREDRMFNYRGRLKDENGVPIEISPQDIYVELSGSFSKGDPALLRKDALGIGTMQTYLPSTLFKGVNEGKTIRFYFDDQLVELTCCQSQHQQHSRFEEMLSFLQAKVSKERSQGLWKQDIPENAAKFKDEFYGEIISCQQIDGQSRTWKDFTVLDADEAQHGPYKRLEGLAELRTPQDEPLWILNAHRDHVSPSEIVLAETRGFNGQRQLWIITPHKPEQNTFPDNKSLSNLFPDMLPDKCGPVNCVTCHYSDGRHIEFTREVFNPQQGHRLATYHYGTYLHLNLPEGKTYECKFNSAGWLQLTFLKAEQSG